MVLEILRLFEGTALSNLFSYLTFRSALAAVSAFLIALFLGPPVIALLRRKKIGEDAAKSDSAQLNQLHVNKSGTPTMGGILILGAVLGATLLFGNLRNGYVQVGVLAALAFGITGCIDDVVKLVYRNRPGLAARTKMALLLVVSLAVAIAVIALAQRIGEPNPYQLRLPFFKDRFIDLSLFHGLAYLLFCVGVLAASTNAVNLTDGLDGLATGCATIAAGAFGVIVYVTGRVDYAEYLQLPYIRGAGELTILCAALGGGCLGFLWFNAYPAQVFMGDTGSLSIGGLLGYVAIVSRQELVLPIVGGVFVMEAGSVILQVGSFKLRKKRIFKIAPIHHHFQFAGWHEVKVVVRFWIFAVVFAILGLATLKVR